MSIPTAVWHLALKPFMPWTFTLICKSCCLSPCAVTRESAIGFGFLKNHFLTVGMAFVALYIRVPKICLPEKYWSEWLL